MHNALAENLMGRPRTSHDEGSTMGLDWYGNIIVVKSRHDGKMVNFEEDDAPKAVDDVTM